MLNMIPDQNANHVVLRTLFQPRSNPINDLIKALQDTNILPRRVPVGGGMAVHIQQIERLDLKLELKYRVFFDDMRLDAYVDPKAPGGNEVRLGVPLRQGAVDVSAIEISTGNEISRFQYAFTGRAFVYGSIEPDVETGAPYFVISRLPDFKLDDSADRIPPLLPAIDFEAMLSRIINREVRARPTTLKRPGLVRFPISFKVDDLLDASPLTYGVVLRDPLNEPDPLSKELCLPPGYGSPDCGVNKLTTKDFYNNLDSFLRVATSHDPVSLQPNDRAIQINVGWRVIERELTKDNGWEDWKEVAAKMFRFRVGKWVNWHKHPDGRGSVRVEFQAKLQVAYPKIKWCKGWTKLPFGGRISYKYPCGIKRGWHPVKSVKIWVDVRLEMQDNRACLQILDKGSTGKNDILGYLITVLYLVGSAVLGAMIPILGPILSGVVAMASGLVMLVIFAVEKVIGPLLKFLPDEVCTDISEFLTIPLLNDKLQVKLKHGRIEFVSNGLIVMVDPEFEPNSALLSTTDDLSSMSAKHVSKDRDL